MTDITTMEQLREFTHSGALSGTITGELGELFAKGVSASPPLPITYQRHTQQREWNGEAIPSSPGDYLVHFGNTRIPLGNILWKLGIE
ncbi:hypothetical protein [Nocardia sp. NPDC057455]|uniref:hypothetical protein n=1 Tax=Nocardia sp. NPDC057455 TaxID=3346138 RepID=UPI003670A0F9